MDAYPRVNRIISPGCIRPPISSHTEIVMLPVLSATLQDLTSWPSLVLVTRPISSTIKTIFKFFCPGLISFMKMGRSPSPFIARQVRGPGRGGLGTGAGEAKWRGQLLGTGKQPWRPRAEGKKEYFRRKTRSTRPVTPLPSENS